MGKNASELHAERRRLQGAHPEGVVLYLSAYRDEADPPEATRYRHVYLLVKPDGTPFILAAAETGKRLLEIALEL